MDDYLKEDYLDYKVYNEYYYNKILPNETIRLIIFYDPKNMLFDDIVCDLSLFYKDSYNNYYSQPLSLSEKSINEPIVLSKKEYKTEVDNCAME